VGVDLFNGHWLRTTFSNNSGQAFHETAKVGFSIHLGS